jgi:hypothetical protein
VAVVSDLGIGSVVDLEASVLSEWLAFCEIARAAGCPPIALVPFGPQRWPEALARRLTFVHWSERTTVRQIARAMRESARRSLDAV